MGASLAERTSGARVALVGSGSSYGHVVRQALVDFGVPGSRVDLYGVAVGDEPVISEYAGEARLIQQPEVGELTSRDVVFLCEAGGVVDDLFGSSNCAHVSIVDVVHARPAGRPARLVHMDVNPAAATAGDTRVLAVPHDLSTLLVDLLHPLDAEFGCEEAIAFVLRPASDAGQSGVDELRRQTVGLLNFASTPTEVFGRQLAFNIVPQSEVGESGVESRIAEEVATLLGWDRRRLSLSLGFAPVFFGHTVQLRVRTERSSSAEALRAVFALAGLVPDADDPRTTPMDVSTEKRRCISRVADDGSGGYWLWAVAGEARVRNAELAVRLADAVCAL
ncbi:MAG TPA: Asd/ArgC dimerization domain-containing protein [Candidatus Polarisedimenticolaceae bacterium]|nr:Asd/ArgC dimerization domain-containing protein [Candidatus Polarisedimenticolaceae bacterium]